MCKKNIPLKFDREWQMNVHKHIRYVAKLI